MLSHLLKNVTSNLRTYLLRAPREQHNHVVVLSQFYPPEHHIFSPDVAAAAAEDGQRVTVVTGYPNRPGGKLHSGYTQRFRHCEIINDILVHRVPLAINHSPKAIERIANFLSFSLSALTATPAVKDADVVYVYATPATAAIPAQVWRKLFGIPYVLHVPDLWPESVTGSGMLGEGHVNKATGFLLNIWLKRLYGNADKLIAIAPGMRQLLMDRGHRPTQCATVYNWAEEHLIEVKPAEKFSSNGLKLLYAGNLGPMQDIETMLAAARRLEQCPGFQLEIAGEGVQRDTVMSGAAGSRSIQFLGNLSLEAVTQRYLAADFQLVTLKDLPIFRSTIPSKLQVSLASGVPVITTVAGDVADLITEHNAGIVVPPEDPDALAEAFTRAYAMTAAQRAQMGANARRLYVEHMSRRAGTTRIVSILHDTMHHNARKVLLGETS